MEIQELKFPKTIHGVPVRLMATGATFFRLGSMGELKRRFVVGHTIPLQGKHYAVQQVWNDGRQANISTNPTAQYPAPVKKKGKA